MRRDGRLSLVRLNKRLEVCTSLPIIFLLGSGCALQNYSIDVAAVNSARLALAQQTERDLYYNDEDDDENEDGGEGSVGSAILGELLAIFPGVVFHGVGHLYAGDSRTFWRLNQLGQLGYVLTASGGGLIIGGYFLDKDDSEVLGQSLTDPIAYGMYGTGGVAAGIGVVYFLSAWIYDMVDTPRAVMSGGRPPPRSGFIDALEIFQ